MSLISKKVPSCSASRLPGGRPPEETPQAGKSFAQKTLLARSQTRALESIRPQDSDHFGRLTGSDHFKTPAAQGLGTRELTRLAQTRPKCGLPFPVTTKSNVLVKTNKNGQSPEVLLAGPPNDRKTEE